MKSALTSRGSAWLTFMSRCWAGSHRPLHAGKHPAGRNRPYFDPNQTAIKLSDSGSRSSTTLPAGSDV